ncbi:unnamed protein product, partial [Prorocentrum cordatum]
VVLGPRGAAKAAALAAEFPGTARVAGSNQEVVDAVDCVVVAVLPRQAEEVLRALTFREGQQVLSLVATLPPSRLRELAAPAAEVAVAVPLPAVARRQGATLLIPPVPFAQAVFAPLGSCVSVDDEAQFRRLQSVTALMGDFYARRQLTVQQWLVSHGVPEAQAAAWVGADFATMAADSAGAGAGTLAALVAEQTPGGMNEMVPREEADGSYQSLLYSLDAVHRRFATGKADPELAPAVKRQRTQ